MSGPTRQRSVPAVKICGLRRAEDARAADALGVDYLGVVLTAGFSRSVPPADARSILAGTGATRVAVLVDEPPDQAARLAREVEAEVLQLHGEEDPAVVRALRERGPWRVWKAVRARDADTLLEAARRYGPLVDALLVEGFRPGVVGGGGARLAVAPEAVRRARAHVSGVVLAGGLTPVNVAEMVRLYEPDVVDVSSGVESEPGAKDPALLEAFVHAARKARTEPHS